MKTLEIKKVIKTCCECPLLATDRDEGYYCNAGEQDAGWLRDEDVNLKVSDKCPLPDFEL